MTTQSVFGIVQARGQAAAVARDVARAGFSTSDISVLIPQTTEAVGGRLTDAVGSLTGLVPVTIPGLRPTFGAGPLIARLAGWSAGGLTHGLTALRIPHSLAKQYQHRINEGSILLSIETPNPKDLDRLEAILLLHKAQDIGTTTPRTATGPMVIAL